MKTKSNLLLIFSIALFVILIIGKPLVVATKNYFINEYGTYVLIKSPPPTTTIPTIPGTPTTTVPRVNPITDPFSCVTNPDISMFDENCIPPLPVEMNPDYKWVATRNLNTFNAFKALSLSLIALALFIRYKQRI